MTYCLVFVALSLLTAGQLLQKLGVDRVARSGSETFLVQLLWRAEIWWALLCMTIGTGVWLLVLYQMEVSKAFPFLSLQFVIVVVLARVVFHEVVTSKRWLGVAFIVAGVVMVAST